MIYNNYNNKIKTNYNNQINNHKTIKIFKIKIYNYKLNYKKNKKMNRH